MPIDSNGRGILCEACQNIFCGQQILTRDVDSTKSDDRSWQWNSRGHHPSLQSLLKASDSGCPICYLFESFIGEVRLELFSGLFTSNEFSCWVLEREEIGGYLLNIGLHDEYDELIESRLELELEVLPLNSMPTNQMRSGYGRITYV